ncbi:MAG TPA: hypothetical protein VK856_01945 [Anaerolineaceae bacterium]|nr:hypothetical protein [Anaerolineaceae bacterium]
MQAFKNRFNYLFKSTKGLILVAIAFCALISAFFGSLSGPMADLGVKEVIVNTFAIDLVEAEREGRLIMLYHVIAMAVIAIETYMITDLVPMKEHQRVQINSIITFGYLSAIIGGLSFAYWGTSWIMHGIYIAGLTLIFFAGCLLAYALWPWRDEYKVKNKAYAHTIKGYDLERVAFFSVSIVTLASAIFGAIPGSFYGNGFFTFLAENVVREPIKTTLQKSIIGHLHIMLALIAIACTLIICRYMDFKGILHKIAMPLLIFGSIVLSVGTWLVVPFEGVAHAVIYGGSTVAMLGALLLVIFSWDKLIKTGLAEKGLKKGNFFQGVAALVRDPLKFGVTWQMVFMNFTVSGVGIFVAVKLDEIFRRWPFMDEKLILTGHWHILATLTATILLLYYADFAGLKGKARQWFGWSVIIFSDLAFGAVTVYEMKRLFVEEAYQQPVVNVTNILGDIGLVVVLLALAGLMIWRLIDLFKKNGRWSKELHEKLESYVEEN